MTCIFPDKLKIAKVIPLLKKGDDTIFHNYRPISILPAISKMFERVMFCHIHKHFHSNNIYYDNQYGFREKHSTELATLEIIDRIVQELDQSATPLNIYLDLSKAFDTIDHNILLHKLNDYGINGAALDLCKNYISHTICRSWRFQSGRSSDNYWCSPKVYFRTPPIYYIY